MLLLLLPPPPSPPSPPPPPAGAAAAPFPSRARARPAAAGIKVGASGCPAARRPHAPRLAPPAPAMSTAQLYTKVSGEGARGALRVPLRVPSALWGGLLPSPGGAPQLSPHPPGRRRQVRGMRRGHPRRPPAGPAPLPLPRRFTHLGSLRRRVNFARQVAVVVAVASPSLRSVTCAAKTLSASRVPPGIILPSCIPKPRGCRGRKMQCLESQNRRVSAVTHRNASEVSGFQSPFCSATPGCDPLAGVRWDAPASSCQPGKVTWLVAWLGTALRRARCFPGGRFALKKWSWW